MIAGIILCWIALNVGFAAGAWWCARNSLPADAPRIASATCSGSVMDRAPAAPVDSADIPFLHEVQ